MPENVKDATVQQQVFIKTDKKENMKCESTHQKKHV